MFEHNTVVFHYNALHSDNGVLTIQELKVLKTQFIQHGHFRSLIHLCHIVE